MDLKYLRTQFQPSKSFKDQVAHHTIRVLINAADHLILYTDASTKAIGGVLMQVQGGKEKPCSMELELFAFVFCVGIFLLTYLVNFLL